MNRLQRTDKQTLRNFLIKEAVDRKIEDARNREPKTERSKNNDKCGIPKAVS